MAHCLWLLGKILVTAMVIHNNTQLIIVILYFCMPSRAYAMWYKSHFSGIEQIFPSEVCAEIRHYIPCKVIVAKHRRRKMLEVEGALDINARKARAKFFGHAPLLSKPRPSGRPRDVVGVHWHDFLGCSDQEMNSK